MLRKNNDFLKTYLDNAGKFTLLTSEQEKELGLLVQVGIQALKEINTSKKMTRTRDIELEEAVKAGEKAKTQFIEANLLLVPYVIKIYYPTVKINLDIIQDGNLGLIRAVEKFDPTKNVKFSSYAVYWIRQSISRQNINTGKMIRIPIQTNEKVNKIKIAREELSKLSYKDATMKEMAEKTGFTIEKLTELLSYEKTSISLDNLMEQNFDLGNVNINDFNIEEESVEDMVIGAVDEKIKKENIKESLDKLTELERKFIILNNGLTGTNPLTIGEISKLLKISPFLLRQARDSAFLKLKESLIDPKVFFSEDLEE
jgi:RNA polymerase sigma factor (sigma-70 family)